MIASSKINGFFTILQRLFKKNNKINLESFKKNEVEEIKEKDYNFENDEFLLISEIEEVKFMLEQAKVEFNNQTDFDLISSSIYYIRALETKLNYLIKKARKNNVRCSEKLIFS